jgi:hypothetical protein
MLQTAVWWTFTDNLEVFHASIIKAMSINRLHDGSSKHL